jgi:hypothetical protein
MQKEKVRSPTDDELKQLKQHLIGLGNDEEYADTIISNHFFGVFEKYISDCPAYSGKLMIAVYGMPEFYETFIWVDNKIQKCPLDTGFIQDTSMSANVLEMLDLANKIKDNGQNKTDVYALADLVTKYFNSGQEFDK